MENKTYYYADKTSHGISIQAEEGHWGSVASGEPRSIVLIFENWGVGPNTYRQSFDGEGFFETPEEAVDHLKAELLMKASKLRLQADKIMDTLKAFEELERTQPPITEGE